MVRFVRPMPLPVALPPRLDAAHALVVRAEVSYGAPGLGDEPITTAELRASDGSVRVVRVVGGPSRSGGVTRLAGSVVPALGAIVRADLAEERAPVGVAWTPGIPAATWAAAALPVPFTLATSANGVASRDLGADALSELDVALRTWPRVACTAFRATLAGTAALTPGDDGTNGVFWHDDAWPPELQALAVGQTILHTDAAGNLHDADVHLNGADYRWSTTGAAPTIDARSILTHELGHALGLGHSADPRATMYATNPPGISWRSLEQDDRDGVCALYPGTGAPGCEVGPPCPGGFVCVAHVCERRGARAEVCSPCARVPGACEGAGDDARCIDLGDGGAGGRVCGRACATNDDCGPRFVCAPTTASGDVQCVPTDGCASGPDPCTSDAECGGDACLGGACVGAPALAPAGDGGAPTADASADAAVDTRASASGGCALATPSPRAPGGPVAAACALASALLARRRRGRSS